MGLRPLDVGEEEIEEAFKPWIKHTLRSATGRLVALKPRGTGDAGFILFGVEPDRDAVFREVKVPLGDGMVHVFHKPSMHSFPPTHVFAGRMLRK